jgi:hypothetical protein
MTLSETCNIGIATAHLVVRINYIHEEIVNGNIQLKFINSDDQVADVLTKALPMPNFKEHADKLLKGFDGRTPAASTIQSKRRQATTSKKTPMYK